MHRRTLGRLAALMASCAILLFVAVPAALGKEGVSVDLVAPLPREAQPGTKVAASYTMTAIADDVASPLHSATTFIRLYGRTGAMTEAVGVEQKTPGLYMATVEIPAGGIARGEFGIRGPAKAANGKVVATDVVWPYDGALVTAAPPPPANPNANPLPATKQATTPASEPVATGSSVDPRLALLAGLGLAAIVGAALLGRRRRLQPPTAA